MAENSLFQTIFTSPVTQCVEACEALEVKCQTAYENDPECNDPVTGPSAIWWADILDVVLKYIAVLLCILLIFYCQVALAHLILW